jgi:hypothetical protein
LKRVGQKYLPTMTIPHPAHGGKIISQSCEVACRIWPKPLPGNGAMHVVRPEEFFEAIGPQYPQTRRR